LTSLTIEQVTILVHSNRFYVKNMAEINNK
jgi:hypothetical protein